MKLLMSSASSVYWSSSASMFLSRMNWMCCLNIRPSLVSGMLVDSAICAPLQSGKARGVGEGGGHRVVAGDHDAEPVLVRLLDDPRLRGIERRALRLGRGRHEPARLPRDDHVDIDLIA